MKYFVTLDHREIEVVVDGERVHLLDEHPLARVSEVEGTPVRMLTIGDRVYRVVVERGSARGDYTLAIDGFRLDLTVLDERTRAIRAMGGAAVSSKGPAPLRAPMPGMIVRVNVEVGDAVHTGQGVVVMEAMKMENELRSASSGVVRNILAKPGTAVEKGALLLELE